MGLSIDIGMNTRAAQSGAKDLSKALDSVADSVDDVVRDTERGGQRVERSFRDIVTEAKKAERQIDDIGSVGKSSMGKASESVSEFKNEAVQNLSEVTSSFNGDMASIGDLVQGTFGGLASSLPGVLGIAGAGAAVGVGLITQAFVAADEERKKFQERAADLAGAYIDAGQKVLDVTTSASRVSAVLTGEDTRKQAEELVKVLGTDLPTAARIVAGDTNALETAQKLLEDRQSTLSEAMRSTKNVGEEQMIAFGGAQGAINVARKELEKYSESNDLAAQLADAHSKALHQMIEEAGSATVEVDALGNKLYTLPDETKLLVSADTGAASTNVDQFKGDVDGIAESVTTTVKVRTDTSELDALRQRLLTPLGIKVNVQAPAGIAKWQ